MLPFLLPLAVLPFAIGDRPAWVVSLAENGVTLQDPLIWLPNVGMAGAIIVLWISGKLTSGKEVERLDRNHEREVKRLTEELDRVRADLHTKDEQIARKDILLDALQSQITGHALPAIASTTRALEAVAPPADPGIQTQLEESLSQLTALMQQLGGSDKGS